MAIGPFDLAQVLDDDGETVRFARQAFEIKLLLVGTLSGQFFWLIWAFVWSIMGLRHPPPHDDLSPLGWPRTLIGIGTALLFVLIFVPVPFYTP